MRPAIGIDLGGSSIKAVLVTPQGKILRKELIPFDAGRRLEWAEKVAEIANALSHAATGPKRLLPIGLSAPGLATSDQAAIAHMPGRLHGLEGLNWTRLLRSPLPVPVLNDAHAALLGECWVGAARHYRNVIMLTLGTGVGGAAMVDGQLLLGEIGRAGHLGHSCLDPNGPPDVCGTPGSLELAIGNCTIWQRSRWRFESTHELLAAARAGDAEAEQVWLKSVRNLACAIASFINVLDPAAVIIGGGIARARRDLFGPLKRFLNQVEWRPGGHRVKILPAQLGEFAGAYGAAWRTLQRTKK